MLGHLLVFWNCDSRTAVPLGSPVSSPGTLGSGPRALSCLHPSGRGGPAWPCTRVRHDREARGQQNTPVSLHSVAVEPYGARGCGAKCFLSEWGPDEEEVLETARGQGSQTGGLQAEFCSQSSVSHQSPQSRRVANSLEAVVLAGGAARRAGLRCPSAVSGSLAGPRDDRGLFPATHRP